MRTIAKILLLIIVMTIMMTMITVIVASADDDIRPEGISSTSPQLNEGAKNGIKQIMATFFKYLQLIGSIVAVAILALYGVKWFFASVQNKAELKQQLWGYVIGAMLVFGASTIMGWMGDMFNGVIGTSGSTSSTSSSSSTSNGTGVIQR